MTDLFVQYGCGLSAPPRWKNFDASPTLRLQRLPALGSLVTWGRVRFPANVEYGNILRGLPIADAACEAVYCSHVLEHLSLEDFQKALRETHRILKLGGTFRGVLPDLEVSIQEYVADRSPDASIRFMNSTLLGMNSRTHGFKGLVQDSFGNSRHLWMWDYKGLAKELAAAGFRGIRRAQYGDNAESHFVEVEDLGRWQGCLGFECKR